MFPFLSRVCSGVIFETVEMVRQLTNKASMKTGLKVFASILDKTYETGRSTTAEFRENMPSGVDEDLPMWNYRAIPQSHRVRSNLILVPYASSCASRFTPLVSVN